MITAPAIEGMPIEALEPHPANPNRGDVGAIADLIIHNGWYGAVLIQNRDNEAPRIFVGEHRWRALAHLQRAGGIVRDGGEEEALSYDDLVARAELLGLPALPPAGTVFVQRFDIPDDVALRHMLADNRSHDLASYDDGVLAGILTELALSDELVGTGFDEESLDALLYQLRLAEGPLDTTNTVKTPGDRADDYLSKGIRSVILPLPADLHDELVRNLATLRSAWAIESNAEVVLRLASDAAGSV